MTYKTPVAVAAMVGSMMTFGHVAQAQSVQISRCNVLSGGSFVPALIVSTNGQRQVFGLGDNGLTRRMIFNEGLARAFVITTLGLPDVDFSYGDCAGSGGGIVAPPPPVVLIAAGPPDPEDCGGECCYKEPPICEGSCCYVEPDPCGDGGRYYLE